MTDPTGPRRIPPGRGRGRRIGGPAPDELRRDVVVMDIKMPGMDGLSAAERRIAPVLVLTAFGQRDPVDRAAKAGAMGCLVKPFQKGDVVQAIELAVARYQEAVALEREVRDLGERLETRTLVDRARGILMDRYGMREADAFRSLQKTAMDRRLKLREMARRVVDGEMEA